MELTQNNLVYYLIDTGIITVDSVVDGDFTVVEISRRNRNYKVIRKHHPGFFIKQDRKLSHPGASSLYYEARLYQRAHESEQFRALVPIIPVFKYYDPAHNILILDLIADGVDLYAYHFHDGTFSLDVAELLGKALGCLHNVAGPTTRMSQEQTGVASTMPWIFSFCREPVYPAEYMSDGNIQMLEIIQTYPEFRQTLEYLTPQWRSDTLIHNDIKLENCILFQSPDSGTSALKLVDWEMAIFGDPLWDIGAVFQAYLTMGIRAMQAQETQPNETPVTHKLTFSHMQIAIRRFWETYIAAVDMDSSTVDRALENAVLYAGIRLIQTAFEQTQGVSHLSPDVVYQLQASSNILKKPQDGIEQLLGQ